MSVSEDAATSTSTIPTINSQQGDKKLSRTKSQSNGSAYKDSETSNIVSGNSEKTFENKVIKVETNPTEGDFA